MPMPQTGLALPGGNVKRQNRSFLRTIDCAEHSRSDRESKEQSHIDRLLIPSRRPAGVKQAVDVRSIFRFPVAPCGLVGLSRRSMCDRSFDSLSLFDSASYPYQSTPHHALTHARTHARTYSRTHARTHSRTHARAHARTHARMFAPLVRPMLSTGASPSECDFGPRDLLGARNARSSSRPAAFAASHPTAPTTTRTARARGCG
jgi:hypothetical protein